MEKKIKAAGYIRVSTLAQVKEGESIDTQRKSIEAFVKKENIELVQIYADEGISGGSVRNRHGLLQCLKDGLNGKFSVIIIYRLSRFGRNALELLNNYKELQRAGIQLRSISEGIDFSTFYQAKSDEGPMPEAVITIVFTALIGETMRLLKNPMFMIMMMLDM